MANQGPIRDVPQGDGTRKWKQNMQAIPRKQRAMVRKGIKAGLESAIDEDIERFFSAYSASVHRLAE